MSLNKVQLMFNKLIFNKIGKKILKNLKVAQLNLVTDYSK